MLFTAANTRETGTFFFVIVHIKKCQDARRTGALRSQGDVVREGNAFFLKLELSNSASLGSRNPPVPRDLFLFKLSRGQSAPDCFPF